MNICPNAFYRLRQGAGFSKRVICYDQLINRWSIQQIKEFIKSKAIVINYCGKCDYCLSLKRQAYKKRVRSQLKKSKFNYLITLTFDNSNIDLLLTPSQKNKLLDNNISLSPISNLSKTTISNIIKNWKNKINRYYGEKVDFNYFLCGEYGENTKRAHYHVLLMLNKELPNLKRQHVKGNHYKSDIIDSKQYALYDIEPADMSTNTANYISKYLSKSADNSKGNYNRFHNEQIEWLINNGQDPNGLILLNKKEDLKYLFLWFLLEPKHLLLYSKLFNWNKIKVKEVKQQRPFVKSSRGLGMWTDPYDNYKNGVINRYYFNKYQFTRDVNYLKGLDTSNLDYVLKLYNDQRRSNIQKYFFNSTTIKENKNNKNDIF